MSASFNSLLALLNQQSVNFSNVNQNELLAAARSHRIINHIYKKLLADPSVPDGLLQKFKIESQLNQRIALQQMQTLIELKELLNQHNIPVIFLKGLLLSQQLYNDIGMRTAKDIDLIIPREQLCVVDALLQKNGYISHFPVKLKQKYIEKIQFTYKDITYSHLKNNIPIELHWYLDCPYTFNIPFAELWQHRRTVQLMGHDFYILANEEEWLYLCDHGTRHGWKRLHWLFDVVNYYQMYFSMDNSQISKRTKKYQIKKQYELAIFLMKQYFSSLLTTPLAINKTGHRYTRTIVQQQLIACEDVLGQWLGIKFELYLCCIYSDYKNLCYLLANRVRRHYLIKWMDYNLPNALFFLNYPFYGCYIFNKWIKKLLRKCIYLFSRA